VEARSRREKTGEDFRREEKITIMLFMHKQIVVSLSDLRFVSVACPLCKTIVTLDMKEPHELAQKHDNAFCPKDCPGCRKQYDSAIRPSIDGFQKAYAALGAIASQVSFQGEVESATI
jgi:hypothetical protein